MEDFFFREFNGLFKPIGIQKNRELEKQFGSFQVLKGIMYKELFHLNELVINFTFESIHSFLCDYCLFASLFDVFCDCCLISNSMQIIFLWI